MSIMIGNEAGFVSVGSNVTEVLEDTWGAPTPRKRYPLNLLLYRDDSGMSGLLSSGDLDSQLCNPFFFGDFDDVLLDRFSDLTDDKEGTVWRWTGYYMKYKNGGCSFSGKFVQIPLS